jgi:DNA repair exonuclease SbcCD ATPase subunit
LRPHINNDIAKLETLATQWSKDIKKLQELRDELQHRSSSRAQQLATKVEKLIAETSPRQRQQKNSGETVDSAKNADRHTQEINELKSKLVQAGTKITSLTAEVTSLKGELLAERSKKSRGSSSLSAYELICVTESIPDFALKALRNAYRKAFHPDVCDLEAPEAQKHFIAYEKAFDQIEMSRKGK